MNKGVYGTMANRNYEADDLKLLTVRVPPYIRNFVQVQAKREGVTASRYLREMLIKHVPGLGMPKPCTLNRPTTKRQLRH